MKTVTKVSAMHWEKISDDEYHGFEWASDQSDEALRAVLICEDRGIGFTCDTDAMDSNLNYDEIIEISMKMSELNKELAGNGNSEPST